MNLKAYGILIPLLIILNTEVKAQKTPQLVFFENSGFLSAPKGYSHIAKIDMGNAWMLIISGQFPLTKKATW